MMPFSGNISRGYTGTRSADGDAGSIEGSIVRKLTGYRDITGILNSISSTTRKLTAKRTITGSSGLFTGSINAAVAKLIAGLLVMAGVVTRKIIAARSITGITDQATGSIDRKLSAERKVVGNQAAFSGSVFKGFFRSVVGVCGTIQAILTKKVAFKKLINGDITLTGVIVRKLTASRHIQGVFDWAGTITRKLTALRHTQGVLDWAGATDAAIKSVVKIFGSLGQLSGDVERKFGAKRSVTGTWTMNGQIARAVAIARILTGTISALAGAIVRRLNWPIPDKILDAYRIDLHTIQVSYTDRANIKNTMSARYAKDWSGHKSEIEADRAVVTATDSDSVTKYGTLEGEQTTLPYIVNADLAQRIINGMLVDQKEPRLIVSLRGGSYLSDIERGDIIAFLFEDDDELDKALLGLVATTDRFRVFFNDADYADHKLYLVKL